MAVAPKIQYLSPQEYLERERASEVRHEYLNGEIVAMAGASFQHTLLVSRLLIDITHALAGADCVVLTNDLRVWVERRNSYLYPDLVLICEEPIFLDSSQDTLTNPTIIVEVLSRSTQAYDRSEKWRCYQTLPSLKAYVLVSQETPCVEWYERTETGWSYHLAEGMEAEFKLTCLNISLTLSSIYAKVTFPPRILETTPANEGNHAETK